MATLASLNVFLGLNSAEFRRGLQSSTKDLKSFSSSAAQQAKNVASVFSKISAGAIAAAPVVAYAVNQTINSLEEVRKEASNVGIAAEQWQAYSFAAKNAGLESDNFKDVIKDLNAKITDAALTGGGAMIDFFTQSNQSASDWAKLDPASQFERFVTEINKLPQSEARFWLDEINDSAAEMFDTLVANNGEFFKNAQRAKDLGIVLSGDVLSGVHQSRKEIVELNTQFGALWRNTVAVAAPVITQVAKGIRSWLEESIKAKGGFTGLGQTIALSMISGVSSASVTLERFLNQSAKAIDEFGESLGTDLWNTNDAEKEISSLNKEIEKLISTNEVFDDSFGDIPVTKWVGTEQDQQRLRDLRAQVDELIKSSSKVVDFSGVRTALASAKLAIESYKPVIVDTSKELKSLGDLNGTTLLGMADDWDFLNNHIKQSQISTEGILKSSYDNIQSAASSNFTDILFEQRSASEALGATFRTVASSIVQEYIKMGIQRVTAHLTATTAEETINAASRAKRIAGATTEGAAITAAMTPAAAATTAATAGTSAISATIAFSAFMALVLASLAGAREKGGYTGANRPYLVGERGPELFMPSTNGHITSNDNLKRALNGNPEPSEQHVSVINNFYGSPKENQKMMNNNRNSSIRDARRLQENLYRPH